MSHAPAPTTHRIESSPTVKIDREEIRRRLKESGWPGTDEDLDGVDPYTRTVETAAYAPPLSRLGRVEARRCTCGAPACPTCALRGGR